MPPNVGQRTATTFFRPTAPTATVERVQPLPGDQWINTTSQQLYVWLGVAWQRVGTDWTALSSVPALLTTPEVLVRISLRG